jgi:parallel beta-helix repeat protein
VQIALARSLSLGIASRRMRIAGITTLLAGLTLIGAAPASAQPACGEVITQSTTLTADLNCNFQGEGVTIGAPGITLDLGGHRISTFGTAVRNPGYAGVTIRNGSITFDTAGVVLIGATRNTVRDLAIDGLITGIELRNSDGNRVVSNNLLSAEIQVDENSDGNVVRDNVTRGHEGIISVGGSHNRVVRNVVWTSEDTAMGLGGHHNEVLHNALVAARGTLLHLGSGGDNLIADNDLIQYESGYGDRAVQLNGSSRNLFRGNRISGAPLGIWIESGADNAFRRNVVDGEVDPTFTFLEPDGFRVEAAATGTLLQNNDVHGFADDGLDVEAPGTVIRRNNAHDNGDLGIEAVAGAVDGGGNEASGNGNPLQCVNVFCG